MNKKLLNYTLILLFKSSLTLKKCLRNKTQTKNLTQKKIYKEGKIKYNENQSKASVQRLSRLRDFNLQTARNKGDCVIVQYLKGHFKGIWKSSFPFKQHGLSVTKIDSSTFLEVGQYDVQASGPRVADI